MPRCPKCFFHAKRFFAYFFHDYDGLFCSLTLILFHDYNRRHRLSMVRTCLLPLSVVSGDTQIREARYASWLTL
jgi:hypothetical protein